MESVMFIYVFFWVLVWPCQLFVRLWYRVSDVLDLSLVSKRFGFWHHITHVIVLTFKEIKHLSDYRTVGLSDRRTIGLSDCRIIATAPTRKVMLLPLGEMVGIRIWDGISISWFTTRYIIHAFAWALCPCRVVHWSWFRKIVEKALNIFRT